MAAIRSPKAAEDGMPIEVRFDEDQELLRITLTGVWPTLPEIIGERSRLIMAGYIRPGVVELVDARAVTRGIPNPSQMRSILHAVGAPPIKRAVLVSSNVQYSAGRIAEVLDPTGVRVFREESVALDWLFHGRSVKHAAGSPATRLR
jgi:hypothetical protein